MSIATRITIIGALIVPIVIPIKQATVQLIPMRMHIQQKIPITIIDLQNLVVEIPLKLIQKALSDAMVLVENKCVS